MTIVCPNCGTSYDVAAEALGPNGRNVRCVRCRETWHARIEDMVRADAMVDTADDFGPAAAQDTEYGTAQPAMTYDERVPRVESPPIADVGAAEQDWTALAHQDGAAIRPRPAKKARAWTLRKFTFGSRPAGRFRINAPMAIGAMAAIAVALVIWRNDVVRLMPQTAAFFQSVGLGVNLRNLNFEGVKVTTEMVNGNRVFVIEGEITASTRKPIELPRLRFVLQDERGADIYAWNSVLEQSVLKPGERVAFKSRLASPPPEARNIVVRFFNRRDIASGSA